MHTLADIKRYFEAGKYGRKVLLGEELKKLTASDRAELIAELDALDGFVFDQDKAA